MQNLVEPTERLHMDVQAGLTSLGWRGDARTARPSENTPRYCRHEKLSESLRKSLNAPAVTAIHVYATQIARDWNVKACDAGFVTRFAVDASYLNSWCH